MTGLSQPAHRYPGLDGLRGLAILMVFAWHYPARLYTAYLGWTWAGVDCFFVLSGFLITGILWDSRSQPHRFRDFYVRRTLRIFPLYYGFWIAMLLLWPLMHWQWNWHYLAWPAYVANFAELRNPASISRLSAGSTPFDWLGLRFKFQISHFWSLCVEEQFYLLWPLVVYRIRRRETLIKVCVAVVLLVPVLRRALQFFFLGSGPATETLYRITPTRVDALVLGGLVALLLRGPERHWVERWRLPVLGMALGTWITAYALRGLVWKHYFDTVDPWVSVWGFSIVDLAAAAVLINVIHPGGLLTRLAGNRWLKFFGRISYGLYIFHEFLHLIFLGVAEKLWPEGPPAFGWAVALAGSTALASLSYYLYERPFLRLKSHFLHQVHRTPEIQA